MKNKIITILFIFIGLLMMSCCDFRGFELSPPYVVTEKKVKVCENAGVHQFAGAYFTVCNTAEKAISELCVSFCLYDEDGNASALGSNCICGTYARNIAPHDKAQIIVSLDEAVGGVLQETYQLDYVYLKKIVYEDGSVWNDEWGMYAW
jgi:hypothetical protein